MFFSLSSHTLTLGIIACSHARTITHLIRFEMSLCCCVCFALVSSFFFVNFRFFHWLCFSSECGSELLTPVLFELCGACYGLCAVSDSVHSLTYKITCFILMSASATPLTHAHAQAQAHTLYRCRTIQIFLITNLQWICK